MQLDRGRAGADGAAGYGEIPGSNSGWNILQEHPHGQFSGCHEKDTLRREKNSVSKLNTRQYEGLS